MPRAAILLLALAPAIAVAAPKGRAKAKPNPKLEAKRHAAKATTLQKRGKLADALVEWKAANELDPKPEWQLAIAQLDVKLDNCADAIGDYEHFLEMNRNPDAAAAANDAIDACRQKLAPPTPSEPPPKPAPPPPPPQPRPFYSDKLGDAFVVAGIAAGVAAAIEYHGATSDLDRAGTTGTYDQRAALVDDAHSKRLYSVILAGGAVAFVAAGVARYLWHDRGVEIVPTGSGMAIAGSF